jgi:hypothetical protein
VPGEHFQLGWRRYPANLSDTKEKLATASAGQAKIARLACRSPSYVCWGVVPVGYWQSASPYDNNNAWFQNLDDGDQNNNNRNNDASLLGGRS